MTFNGMFKKENFEICVLNSLIFLTSFKFLSTVILPGSGRSPGERNGNILQYSCLENPMNRGPGGLQSIELQELGMI